MRNGLDSASLLSLFAWTEAEFNERLQGSPIRRIGYSRWLRNIAVALGNAETTDSMCNGPSRNKQHASLSMANNAAYNKG